MTKQVPANFNYYGTTNCHFKLDAFGKSNWSVLQTFICVQNKSTQNSHVSTRNIKNVNKQLHSLFETPIALPRANKCCCRLEQLNSFYFFVNHFCQASFFILPNSQSASANILCSKLQLVLSKSTKDQHCNCAKNPVFLKKASFATQN